MRTKISLNIVTNMNIFMFSKFLGVRGRKFAAWQTSCTGNIRHRRWSQCCSSQEAPRRSPVPYLNCNSKNATFFTEPIDKASELCYNTLRTREIVRVENSFAGVAELADARDLKSRDTRVSYRFDPGYRHQKKDLFERTGLFQLNRY